MYIWNHCGTAFNARISSVLLNARWINYKILSTSTSPYSLRFKRYLMSIVGLLLYSNPLLWCTLTQVGSRTWVYCLRSRYFLDYLFIIEEKTEFMMTSIHRLHQIKPTDQGSSLSLVHKIIYFRFLPYGACLWSLPHWPSLQFCWALQISPYRYSCIHTLRCFNSQANFVGRSKFCTPLLYKVRKPALFTSSLSNFLLPT